MRCSPRPAYSPWAHIRPSPHFNFLPALPLSWARILISTSTTPHPLCTEMASETRNSARGMSPHPEGILFSGDRVEARSIVFSNHGPAVSRHGMTPGPDSIDKKSSGRDNASPTPVGLRGQKKQKTSKHWNRPEREALIRHLRDLDAEDTLKGDAKFEEAARRLKRDGYERTGSSVANMKSRLSISSRLSRQSGEGCPLMPIVMDAL